MSKSNQMKSCPSCSQSIAANAAVCPHCGAKQKKPFYKRVWFIALCIVIVIAVAAPKGESGSEQAKPSKNPASAASTSSGKSSVAEEIHYEQYSVKQMMDDLNVNALKAEDTYNQKFVEITGELSTIDSSGKYISLLPENDDFAFIGVQCYIKNDEQKQQVMNMTAGERVTLRGKIKHVGEVLGYSLDIDEIL